MWIAIPMKCQVNICFGSGFPLPDRSRGQASREWRNNRFLSFRNYLSMLHAFYLEASAVRPVPVGFK